MLELGSGSIVITSSITALSAPVGRIAYATSKARSPGRDGRRRRRTVPPDRRARHDVHGVFGEYDFDAAAEQPCRDQFLDRYRAFCADLAAYLESS